MCAVQVLEHLEYVEDVVSEVAYCLKYLCGIHADLDDLKGCDISGFERIAKTEQTMQEHINSLVADLREAVNRLETLDGDKIAEIANGLRERLAEHAENVARRLEERNTKTTVDQLLAELGV